MGRLRRSTSTKWSLVYLIPGQNWNLKMLVFKTRENRVVPGEKPLGAKERTKFNSHMACTARFEPGLHWWEASALTTAPPLLPKGIHSLGLVECLNTPFQFSFYNNRATPRALIGRQLWSMRV